MTLNSQKETQTLSKHRYHSVSYSVEACPDPALAMIVRLRAKGLGWEDICVALQRNGFLVSKTDVRRFILGPKRTTAPPRGASQARPLEAD